jgi:electron transfer flavoprotein beta subunit
MEIAVCIKRVPLLGSAIVLTPDSMAIDTSKLGFGLSPHEECAVEAAVQLVEANGGSVTLFSMGHVDGEEQIRAQLAIGADRAVLIDTNGVEPDPQAAASALAEAISAEDTTFDLVIMGSESADYGGSQTGIRVAHKLGLPVVTSVKGLKIEGGIATCERAVGSTREVYTVALPAVITVKDGLNIPRYASVPGRMKARKKSVDIKQVTFAEPRITTKKFTIPEREAKGATSLGSGDEAAAALVDVLKQIGVLT